MQIDGTIHLYSRGGTGDQILAFRLRYLLEQSYKDIKIYNYCCCRDETKNMLKIIYPDISSLQFTDEDWLDRVGMDGEYYIIYPDRLFRGHRSPPLKEWGVTNFAVKQTRTLLGQWKPSNYISLALNSVTNGYTYHSIPELANQLADEFPEKKIYYPIISKWNGVGLNNFDYSFRFRDNVEVDFSPDFSKVYDILCQSDYAITTDNGMMHICHDLGMPYLVLDPQYKKTAFEARWRPCGYYNSIPINTLVETVVNIVKTQINIPETQMIAVDSIVRQNITDWTNNLIFKD